MCEREHATRNDIADSSTTTGAVSNNIFMENAMRDLSTTTGHGIDRSEL